MKRVQIIKKLCSAAMVLLCIICTLTSTAAQDDIPQTASVEHDTVRVGYYPVANYQEKSEDGTYSGFSYDYYIQIQKYTRWNYEFVEASYADCLKMLINGEIDVMSGIGRTESREEQMFFSDYSVSNSQNKLYVRSDNDQLFYESFDTFDGCRVAMMKGMLTDEVTNYAKVHNFQIDIVVYDTMKEMESALLGGEVDLVCASSITNTIDTKIVGRMDKQPLYYAVNNSREDIAQELNDALRKIVDNNPNFYTQMSEKYMISGANATATFTREEMEYINSGKDVYLIVNPDWAPVTWYDSATGEYKGIFIDVIDKIEEYSGLKFKLCTEDEFNALAVDDPDMINNVVAILADDNSWSAQQSVMMTNHVVDSSVVMVTRKGSNASEADITIALPSRFYIGYVMRNELKNKKVIYYDTVKDCLDAVNSGEADATYVNELVSTYYLSTMEYSELYATANSGYYENLAFAVNKDSDAPLLSIFDKSLLCIGTNELEQIIIQNSIAEERFSFRGLFYSNPKLVITLIVVTILVLCGVFVAIYMIIARKKRIERELKKESDTSAARTEFFMMISHELRTPLNAIVGYLNIAAGELGKNNREAEYIRRSQNAAAQLTAISEDMLDYTRIASDSIDMKQELFDLKTVIGDVDQNISIKAAQKNQNYSIKINNILHEYVVGDKLRLIQIMQNLLGNGVKFTPDGGTITALISEKELDEHTIELTFTCTDTGKGMTEEFLDKICAPFNQSDRAYSRTHGGMGLGLFLTKYFVNAMNGTIAVESTVGKGSTFTVVIPLKKPDSEVVINNEINCSHVRTLIGSRSQEDSAQLKDFLKKLGIKCDIVTDPEKLVRRIQSRLGTEYAYSLCIIDEELIIENRAVVKEIAAVDEDIVIFATTDNSSSVDMLAADEGIRQVLYKPVFQSVLFDAVMNTFGEYEPEKDIYEQYDFTGIRAIVAEDNFINADILTRMLEDVHIDVTLCENGQLALDTFNNADDGTYQVIFMDIQMPVMNGYEAARNIRQSKREQGRTIPIIAVSANAFPDDIARSMESGMNEHISKPVNPRTLYEAIDKYCQPDSK